MRLAGGVYEGPASHGILQVAASMRGIHAVLRALPTEGYFPALFGLWAKFEEPAPVSLSPIQGRPGGLRRDVEAAVRRNPETEAVILARSDAALLSGEEIPELSLPDSPKTGREMKLIGCGWELPEMGEHEAADLALEELVRTYVAPQERSETPTVNVFGPPVFKPGAEAEFEEVARLLGMLGVGVNARVPLGTTVEDLARLPRAWANVLLYREVGDSATRFLQEEFGMPRITTPMIGSSGTGGVLRVVGELCSLAEEKVQRVVFSELARTAKLPWYARLQRPEALAGRRAVIFGDFTHAVGLGHALAREIGLEVSWAGTYLKHLEQDFLFHAEAFTDRAFVADDPEEVASRIERTRPDVVIGTYLEQRAAENTGASFLPLCPPAAAFPFVQRPLAGYSGAAVLADALDGVLRRPKVEAEPRLKETEEALPWSEEALEDLEEIPAFLRGRARRLAEERARELGAAEITREILEEARF